MVDASQYGPGTYYESDTFITTTSPYDWSSVQNDNLWGDTTNTNEARQGPCPSGYHVPSNTEWQGIYDNWNNANSVTSNRGRQWASDLLMPFVGDRNYSSAGVSGQGTLAYYWSSTSYSASYAYYFYADSIVLIAQNSSLHAYGFSLRCFKDSPAQTLTLNANEGKNAVIAVAGGKITALGTPTRDGYTFEGWYGDENFADGTKLNVGSDAPSTLYAKWTQNEPSNPTTQYTVTISSNDSSYGTVNPTSVTENEGVGITENGNAITIGETTVTATEAQDTDEWDYSFVNWTNSCGNNLNENCNITANFTRVKKQYNITFVDEDGTTVLKATQAYDYGTPVASILRPSTPTKAATAQYTYTFAGWSPELSNVTSDMTYRATYMSALNKYAVSITTTPGGYGTVSNSYLESDYGTSISISNNNLTIGNRTVTALVKDSDDEYTYTFAGWNNNCGNTLTANCTITANFERKKNSYSVFIRTSPLNYGHIDNGSIVADYCSKILLNDSQIQIGDQTATVIIDKPSDEQYSYTFNGWNSTCGETVTKDCLIIANIKTSINTYFVTRKNYDGAVLKIDKDISYGTTPEYDGATPTKAADSSYTYKFSGWSPKIGPATKDIEYVATFSATKKSTGGGGGGGGGGGSSSVKQTSQKTDQECTLMSGANINFNVVGDNIVFSWTGYASGNINIVVFDPKLNEYKSVGNIPMSDKTFEYKMNWNGEHIFMFTNSCTEKPFVLKLDAKMDIEEDEQQGHFVASDIVNNADVSNKNNENAQDLGKRIPNVKKGWFVEGNPSEILSNGYSRELNNAYVFAYKNGITTMGTIQRANLDGNLTRIAMAKMLSYYAINVLGKTPNTAKGTPKFNDVASKQNADYDNAVTLSYQLGIMGQGISNFRPNDLVTRAEFATALSRMLYSTSDGYDKYYSTHINILRQKGIISNTTPSMIEHRGYVMLMLMRSAM